MSKLIISLAIERSLVIVFDVKRQEHVDSKPIQNYFDMFWFAKTNAYCLWYCCDALRSNQHVLTTTRDYFSCVSAYSYGNAKRV